MVRNEIRSSDVNENNGSHPRRRQPVHFERKGWIGIGTGKNSEEAEPNLDLTGEDEADLGASFLEREGGSLVSVSVSVSAVMRIDGGPNWDGISSSTDTQTSELEKKGLKGDKGEGHVRKALRAKDPHLQQALISTLLPGDHDRDDDVARIPGPDPGHIPVSGRMEFGS